VDGVTTDGLEIAHLADGGDAPVLAEDVRVLDDGDGAELASAQRRADVAGRSRKLLQVTEEDPRHADGDIGTSRPPASAAAVASG
jgi:hypothetical protein